MDLSELNPTPAPGKSAADRRLPSETLNGDAAWGLANQMAVEVAGALTPALDSVRQMQSSGRIDRAGLQALTTQIEQARWASMLGQQIARLAHGGIQQQPEALNLSQALQAVLAQRHDDPSAPAMVVKQNVGSAVAMVDATLLSALLGTLLDWSARHACTAVDIRLDTKAWPAHARLVCRYGHTPPDRVPAGARGALDPARRAALECLSWQLLAQLARTMALHAERTDTACDTTLTLEFPQTVNDSLESAASLHQDRQVTPVDDTRPLAGAQVLVIAARREVLNQIRQTLLPMGVGFDSVSSVGAAREFCQQGLPQAIIYESVLFDSAFDGLRNDIKLQCPELAWIEIVEQGDAFEISSFGGMSMARVGRDAIASSLPSAMMFELARGL
ncbi:MAG TPA: hypothetical protein VI032_01895 [Burkholderiaceae bacterium]